MKNFLIKIRNVILNLHPATVITLFIILVILIPLKIRQAEMQPDFELASRYMEVARFYRGKNNSIKARQAIEMAIRLYDQPFITQKEELADALLERARLVQQTEDLIRSAVNDYLHAAEIKPALKDTISRELLELLYKAYSKCLNPEKDKFMDFFIGQRPISISDLRLENIQSKLNVPSSDWMKMLNYLCIK